MDNSTIEMVVSLIGTVGFPIVCCGFMWKYINTTMAEFTKTMQENTKVLTRICDRIDLVKLSERLDNEQ